jgi:ketosteroid isomerase-like protein
MTRKDFSRVTARLARYAAEKVTSEPQARRAVFAQSVQAQIDAIGRGDLSAALENAHPDVELEIFAPEEFRWIRRAHGVEALRSAIAHNFASVEQQAPEILNIVSEGDALVLFGRERGVIRESGQPYDVQFVHRFTFDADRLRSVRIVAAKTDTPY